MPMVFPTSPTVGQVFSSGGRSWVWTGSTWDSPSGSPFVAPGMTLLTNQAFTNANSVIVNDVFSSNFDSYKIVMGVTGSGTVDGSFQLRASGTNANTNYNDVSLQAYLSGTTVTSTTGQSSARIVRIDSDGALLEILVNNPNRLARTYGMSSGTDSLNVLKLHAFAHTLANSYTGFTINFSNTTGVIRVYGMRNV